MYINRDGEKLKKIKSIWRVNYICQTVLEISRYRFIATLTSILLRGNRSDQKTARTSQNDIHIHPPPVPVFFVSVKMKNSHLYYYALALGITAAIAGVLSLKTKTSSQTAQTSFSQEQKPPRILNDPYATPALWGISCSKGTAQPRCSVVADLRLKGNQRLLGAEVYSVDARSATGVLTLPFGLSVSDGVILQIDQQKDRITLPFSTCLPQGCQVPLNLDEAMLNAMRKGKILKLTAEVSGHDAVRFDVPLQSFSDEFAQMVEQNKLTISQNKEGNTSS